MSDMNKNENDEIKTVEKINTEICFKKKKRRRKILCLLLIVGVISCSTIYVIREAKDILRRFEYNIFHTEETKPDTFKEKIELLKYGINIDKGTIFETEYDNIEKYAKPAWEMFLEKQENMEENYHVIFRVLTKGASFDYRIDVDGNVAKIMLDVVGGEPVVDNIWDIDFRKQIELYAVLENDTINLYTQDENGVWLKTTKEPLMDNLALFDLTHMLRSLDKQKHIALPRRTSNREVIDRVVYDSFNSISFWVQERDVQYLSNHNSTKIMFDAENERLFKIEKKVKTLNYLLEHDDRLLEKDTFLKQMCDKYYIEVDNIELNFQKIW